MAEDAFKQKVMEFKKITLGAIHAQKQSTDYTAKPHQGKSITHPDMVLPIQTLLERSRNGMEIPSLTPIYYGEKYQELKSFEKMSKLEKIEFTRKFKIQATEQMTAMEAKFKAHEEEKSKKDSVTDEEKQL